MATRILIDAMSTRRTRKPKSPGNEADAAVDLASLQRAVADAFANRPPEPEDAIPRATNPETAAQGQLSHAEMAYRLQGAICRDPRQCRDHRCRRLMRCRELVEIQELIDRERALVVEERARAHGQVTADAAAGRSTQAIDTVRPRRRSRRS